jgi:DNA-binding MarR family transcriptional regulator
MTARLSAQPPPSSPGSAPPARDEIGLADVVARLRRAMRRAARASDPTNTLSVAQLELLSCLAENPGARPSQLARLLRLAPNSVTTLVNALQSQKMITRSSGQQDRRAITLALTDTGEQAVHDWQATNTAILRAALASLHPAWQHLLGAALPALAELTHAVDTLAEPARPHTESHQSDMNEN